jgi:hypothetical protein
MKSLLKIAGRRFKSNAAACVLDPTILAKRADHGKQEWEQPCDD